MRSHDLELVFLAETSGVPTLNTFTALELHGGQLPAVRPPILDHIARDMVDGWRDTPRWLGNIEQLLRPVGTTGWR